jgi:hypothetical protein
MSQDSPISSGTLKDNAALLAWHIWAPPPCPSQTWEFDGAGEKIFLKF